MRQLSNIQYVFFTLKYVIGGGQVSPLLALTTPPFCHCPRTGVTRRSPIAHLDSQAVNTQGSTAQIRQVLVH